MAALGLTLMKRLFICWITNPLLPETWDD